MNPRLTKLSLLLTLIACCGAALPAQEKPGALQRQMEKQRKKLAQKRERGDGVEVEGVEDTSPEALRNARRMRGSRGQCRFVPAMRPPQLLPGQSGTLLITAILQGNSVLQAPAQLVVTPRTNGDVVQLGELKARPAKVGTIHAGYRGQPVYENTAVFEVPVTISSAAKLGDRAQVALELEFEIHNGDSAQMVGKFIERVQTQVEIAPYVDPVVEAASSRDAAEPAGEVPAPSAPEPRPSRPAADAGAGGDALGGAASAAEEVPVPVNAAEQGDGGELPPTVVSEGQFPTPLVVGGGVLLLVIALMILRKK